MAVRILAERRAHVDERLSQFLGNAELRSIVQAATNKSESFNDFVKWLAFCGDGVIAENHRGEERKIIKCNHLLA